MLAVNVAEFDFIYSLYIKYTLGFIFWVGLFKIVYPTSVGGSSTGLTLILITAVVELLSLDFEPEIYIH